MMKWTPRMPESPARVFCSTAEAAEMLGVSTPTVRRLLREGELHAFTPIRGGRKQLLYTYEVQLYGRRQRQGSDSAALERVRELESAIRGY